MFIRIFQSVVIRGPVCFAAGPIAPFMAWRAQIMANQNTNQPKEVSLTSFWSEAIRSVGAWRIPIMIPRCETVIPAVAIRIGSPKMRSRPITISVTPSIPASRLLDPRAARLAARRPEVARWSTSRTVYDRRVTNAATARSAASRRNDHQLRRTWQTRSNAATSSSRRGASRS